MEKTKIQVYYTLGYSKEKNLWFLYTEASPYMLLEHKSLKKLLKKFNRAIDFLNETSYEYKYVYNK